MWQYMTYNEYLPLILGPHVMDELGLTIQQQGYWNGNYDYTLSPLSE